ncbi:hypothetical protein TWF281_004464 [Arthrobotrys megalospora]
MRSRNALLVSFLGLQATLAAAGDAYEYPLELCGYFTCLHKSNAGAANFTISIEHPDNGAKYCLEDLNTRSNDGPNYAVVKPCAPIDDQNNGLSSQMWESSGSAYEKYIPYSSDDVWNVDRFAYRGYLKNVGTGRCLAPVTYSDKDRPSTPEEAGYQVYGFHHMVDCNETSAEDPNLPFRNDYLDGTNIQRLYPKEPLGYNTYIKVGDNPGDYYHVPTCNPDSAGILSILMPYTFFEGSGPDPVARWGCIDIKRLEDPPAEGTRKLLAQANNGPLLQYTEGQARRRFDAHWGLCGARRKEAQGAYDRGMDAYNADQRKYELNCVCREEQAHWWKMPGVLGPCFPPQKWIFSSTATLDQPVPGYTEFSNCSPVGHYETPWTPLKPEPATTSCPFEHLAITPQITPPP